MENILIVYFSRSGNTKSIAYLIQQEIGGTLHEIQPVAAYPPAYNEVVQQAKKEIQSNYLPPLKTKIDHLEPYDTFFIGSPNWWDTIAPPLSTFLSNCDLSGKTVVPFCTHGGGGLGNISRDIVKLCPESNLLSAFEIYGSSSIDAQSRVSAWLKKIGMKD